MASTDIVKDWRWDLAIKLTFHKLYSVICEGCVHLTIGGPPCSTTSIARFNQLLKGPRPLRTRGKFFWGLPGLRHWEQARVTEANILWIHSMALMEACTLAGGAHLWEHPEDIMQCEPYPSIFASEEFLAFERRTMAERALLDQCAFEGLSRKPTCLSGTLKIYHRCT